MTEQLPDATILDLPEDQRPRLRPWVLIPCALVAIAVRAGARDQPARRWARPSGRRSSPGLLAFPALPFAWHAVAERQRVVGPDAAGHRHRALRGAQRGGRAAGAGGVAGQPGAAPGGAAGWSGWCGPSRAETTLVPARPTGTPLPPVPVESRHELEPFIPADAHAVVALSDPAVMRQLLAVGGGRHPGQADRPAEVPGDRRPGPDAGGVARPDTRLIVVRAPGVTDPRNLYCLAGLPGQRAAEAALHQRQGAGAVRGGRAGAAHPALHGHRRPDGAGGRGRLEPAVTRASRSTRPPRRSRPRRWRR